MNFNTKEFIIEKIEKLEDKNDLKILDLGSGRSRNFVSFLERHPNWRYVGVEPNKRDADAARELLKKFPNAKIINDFAYQKIKEVDEFDICVSLSVLEHVKRLDEFLTHSVRCVKKGGNIVHLFDLGHALYPHSLKEKLHVALGNSIPKILPEKKFVRYLNEREVCNLLEKAGAKIKHITYHQMPDHKKFFKFFNADNGEKMQLAREICEWEFKISKFLDHMEEKQRENLFPTICIWAVKD